MSIDPYGTLSASVTFGKHESKFWLLGYRRVFVDLELSGTRCEEALLPPPP